MAHVQANGISLAYGDRDILSNVSLNLASGDRCALSGANGSGKSTLMKILAGLQNPDSGTVVASRDCRIIYLPQSGITHASRSLLEEVELAYGEISDLITERDRLADQLQKTDPGDPALEDLVHEHHDVQERIEHSGYYEREGEIDRVLGGLGFRRSDLQRGTSEFSGGWQMRIALAKVLLRRPDFLLLDEPTNYLDVEARVWLGSFLSAYSGGVLMVSHDRRFLDQTVNTVWELFLAEVKRYRGTYSEYERKREQEIEQITASFEQQQEEIRKIEDFVRRFRATASKARQVQSRVKQLEKMERIEIPEHLKRINISFPPAPRSGREVVTLENVSRHFGRNHVLEGLDLVIERGERVVLVGPNGAGKSTLMRIIAGRDDANEGEIRLGASVSGGYYADDDSWLARSVRGADGTGPLSPSVIDATMAVAHGQTEQQIRDMLGAFLFRGDDVYKGIDVLSGGERSRLALLQMLLHPHNLLVLDEPTNHLDLASKDVLLGALRQFGGTIVFVSHDREFIEQLADRVIELRPAADDPNAASIVSDFPGDYHYYAWRLEHQGEEVESGPIRASYSDDGSSAKATPALSHDEQKSLRSRQKRLERTAESLLAQIDDAEARHVAIQHELADPDVYADGEAVRRPSGELEQVESTIGRLTIEWEEISSTLESLAGAYD
ncbi:MAG: ABC-F family ATP-binding cassette domain-containing protein [Spirochaetota bacterium]